MEFKPSKLALTKSFLAVFFIAAVVFFLVCIGLFLFQDWNWVQPVIIGVFLLVSIGFYIITLNAFSYKAEKKYLEVHRFKKTMYYYYSEIIYIYEEKSRKKKQIIFITNKGHVRYLTYDKDGQLLNTLIEKCQNTVSLDEVRRRFPSIKA